MAQYILRRLPWAIVVLVAVWLATFVLAYVVPGDPARALAGAHASEADVERIRTALGLDQPLLTQIGHHLGRLATGDLGYSYTYRRPVLELILQRLPATLLLAAAGLAAQVVIGIPLGILAATRARRRADVAASMFSALGASMPAFWLGYLLLLALAFVPAVMWGVTLFPIGGYESGDPRYLVLPALTLGIAGSAYYIRLMRASLLDELEQPYLIAARARGLSERQVLWRHAVRNALAPVVTQFGLDMGLFLGGVVVVERVFSWPGMGKLALDAVERGDLPVILGTVAAGTVFIVLGSLLADVVNARLDPRIRFAR